MPTVHLPDGRVVHFPYDMAPEQIEAEVSKLVPVEKPAERTWGDTMTDALPLAGGVVGGVVGAVGGIPGMMAGSAIGGGLGEAARQTARGEQLDYGDIATTAGLEGATAGAFGAAGKVGSRLIRGVRKMNVTPTDVVTGGLSSLVSKEMPVIGAVRSGIERAAETRMAREALGSGRLNTGRVDKLNDVLTQVLNDVRGPSAPTRVGGSGAPLRAGKNLPVVNADRSSGMISTQPDKWGTSSIHRADDFVDRSRLVDKARPVVEAPPPSPVAPMRSTPTGSKLPSGPKARGLSEGEERGIQELDQLLDAIHGADRGNPGTSYLRQPSAAPRAQFLGELIKAEPGSGSLTRAGRSMMTDDDALLFERALRDMRSNLERVPRSHRFDR